MTVRLYIDIQTAYHPQEPELNTFAYYLFVGNSPWPDRTFATYRQITETEVQINLHRPESQILFETRVYPLHRQFVRSLIHFLVNSNWPEPTTPLPVAYPFSQFISLERLPYQDANI